MLFLYMFMLCCRDLILKRKLIRLIICDSNLNVELADFILIMLNWTEWLTLCLLVRPQQQSIVMSTSVFVCVCVCLSVHENISWTTRTVFTEFLCMLPIAVAWFSSGGVMQLHGEGAILGVFFPIENALYGCMNFTTKDRFGLNLLLYYKFRQNSISYY